MNIVLSFVLNMKNQAQYPANVCTYCFIIWGELCFFTTACLPARKRCYFKGIFILCIKDGGLCSETFISIFNKPHV